MHSTGALGKQFFETTENIDMKPVEGLRSVGAGYVQTIRFAALPQVIASFTTFTLLRFEINVRGATVLGFVGAGGIGADLMEAIRKFYYSDVSAILVMIIAVVMAIDISTQYLRARIALEGASGMNAASARSIDVAAVKARHPEFFAARLAALARSHRGRRRDGRALRRGVRLFRRSLGQPRCRACGSSSGSSL